MPLARTAALRRVRVVIAIQSSGDKQHDGGIPCEGERQDRRHPETYVPSPTLQRQQRSPQRANLEGETPAVRERTPAPRSHRGKRRHAPATARPRCQGSGIAEVRTAADRPQHSRGWTCTEGSAVPLIGNNAAAIAGPPTACGKTAPSNLPTPHPAHSDASAQRCAPRRSRTPVEGGCLAFPARLVHMGLVEKRVGAPSHRSSRHGRTATAQAPPTPSR